MTLPRGMDLVKPKESHNRCLPTSGFLALLGENTFFVGESIGKNLHT